METITEDGIVQTAAVEGLLNRLTSRYIGERVAAMEALRQLGPTAVNELLAYLREEGERRETKKQWFYRLMFGGVSLAALLAMLLIFSDNAQFLGLLGTFGALGGLAGLLNPSQKQIMAVNLLAQMDDPRTLGPLLEGLAIPFPIVQTACADALMRIAPQIRAEDAAELKPAHFESLHRYLTNASPEKEANLILVALRLLASLEDVTALPAVQKLVERTTKRSPVYDEAKRCIETLESFRARNERSDTLLRATTEPATSPDMLLRAAQGTRATTETQQLLRASNGEAGE